MLADFRAVPSAPNQCEIKAMILQADQSVEFLDKWHLDLEILESTAISGPNFARVGETVKAFTFGSASGLLPGSLISAQAEFVGDEWGGQFRLTQVRVQ